MTGLPTTTTSKARLTKDELEAAAREVLSTNDLGGWTKPAPALYPHQWSWDSAFIAIGLSHYSPDRGIRELETLFNAQWADGRVPHIVFNPEASDYFPGPDRWNCAALNSSAPSAPATSGLIQPPVHAIAAWALWQAAGLHQSRIKALYPKLMKWHRYLATARDPEGWGLISIYHPWESGTDNSPRWDESLARVTAGAVPPYERRDTKHVSDPSERPTQAEYDKFLWLVETLKQAHYDDKQIHQKHPFIVKDVLMSCIFAMANRDLLHLAKVVGAPESDVKEITAWEQRTRNGLTRCTSERTKLALDLDVRNGGKQIDVSTCAGLAPLLVPDMNHLVMTLAEKMFGPDFAGHPGMAFAVIPSTTPDTKGWHPRAYWRGPSWPVINWLYWRALYQHGLTERATKLKDANIALLSRPEARFGEYFELDNGKQLGSPDQSWTAAVALDWLRHGT